MNQVESTLLEDKSNFLMDYIIHYNNDGFHFNEKEQLLEFFEIFRLFLEILPLLTKFLENYHSLCEQYDSIKKECLRLLPMIYFGEREYDRVEPVTWWDGFTIESRITGFEKIPFDEILVLSNSYDQLSKDLVKCEYKIRRSLFLIYKITNILEILATKPKLSDLMHLTKCTFRTKRESISSELYNKLEQCHQCILYYNPKRENRTGPDINFIINTSLYDLRLNLEPQIQNIFSFIKENILNLEVIIEDKVLNFEDERLEEQCFIFGEQAYEYNFVIFQRSYDLYYSDMSSGGDVSIIFRHKILSKKKKLKKQVDTKHTKLLTC